MLDFFKNLSGNYGAVICVIVGLIGTLLGIIGGIIGTYFGIKSAKQSKEMAFVIKMAIIAVLFVSFFVVLMVLAPPLLKVISMLVYALVLLQEFFFSINIAKNCVLQIQSINQSVK